MQQPEISRSRPGYLLFLLDQSHSMHQLFPGAGASKAEFVAQQVNDTIEELITLCRRDAVATQEIRDYFHLSVLGYGQSSVQNALGGGLASQEVVSLSELNRAPLRVQQQRRKQPDGWGGEQEYDITVRSWVEPVGNGRTPTAEGFAEAARLTGQWVREHSDSYPPIVLHITDGQFTGADPEPLAEELVARGTDHGPVVVLNCHITSGEEAPVVFPRDAGEAPSDAFAQKLFRMSSVLRPDMVMCAQEYQRDLQEGARGYLFNAGAGELACFFEIGTAVARAAPQAVDFR